MTGDLEFRLLNAFQRDFPLVEAPYAELARRLATSEEAVLECLRSLKAAGKISRVGAVFAPTRVGSSTLAAMAVPPSRLEATAVAVNAFDEVNHNYEREHRFNLWFVVTTESPSRLAEVLRQIESAAGYRLLSLPLEVEYHIDLGFDLTDSVRSGHRVPAQPAIPDKESGLADEDYRLIRVLRDGLPFSSHPFRVLARQCALSETALLNRLIDWVEGGVIKRFGVVVRHRDLGYGANAMWVQNIPAGEVDRVGSALARERLVTLCYQRRTESPDWPYNLFCMIHGVERSTVEDGIADLRRRLGLDYPQAILFSPRCFKQRGAQYS